MILHDFGDALILDKPAGVTTHTPDGGVTGGFCEIAEQLLGCKLWAVHRLDRDTSGCLLVTRTPGAVAPWTEKLKSGVKRYVFISPKKSEKLSWAFEGRIEKVHTKRFRLVEGDNNSFTQFRRLNKCALGYQYEALITSGKTHQIRIHAEASGIPVLGDSEHGGAPFVRLMLHADSLTLDGMLTASPWPKLFFSRADDSQDYRKFLTSLDRRRFLNTDAGTTDCLRLMHREWSEKNLPQLVIEKLGPVVQFLNYAPTNIPKDFFSQATKAAGGTHWLLRQMSNRGSDASVDSPSHGVLKSTGCPEVITVLENGCRFELRFDQGLSSGLFLDQRENRRYLKAQCSDKKVLNLFSYTCGFSVAAALGGATEVVSVDVSQASLEWGKRNFALNGLEPGNFEFHDSDALVFLKGCVKRERLFDFIILDPPTLSRTKDGVWRVEKELRPLIEAALKTLVPGGQLLVTINTETWDLQEIEIQLKAQGASISPLLRAWDFEFPGEKPLVLKGFWLTKKA